MPWDNPKHRLTSYVNNGHLVEAGGIEPPSRSISAEASTCIVHLLFFLDPQGSGGQDSFWTRAQPTLSSLPRQATGVKTSLLLSPVPVPQAEPDERRGQLSRDRVVCVGTYVVFARCFTRPPDNLGTPLPPQPARSNPIAPGMSKQIQARTPAGHTYTLYPIGRCP